MLVNNTSLRQHVMKSVNVGSDHRYLVHLDMISLT
jgi:hypothetical protein